MVDSLQFLVMVETEKNRQDVLNILLNQFMEATQMKSNSCDLKGNWIEIWENQDADPILSKNEEEGFLYYRWRVEVTPLKNGVEEAKQVQLARDLDLCFKSAGFRAVVCANFEDKL